MFAAVGLVVLMILTGVLYEMAVHNRPAAGSSPRPPGVRRARDERVRALRSRSLRR